ncbi:MAG: hypothetical protein QME46_07355 [Thermoanaerobacteraceae bacterium]|nr:hypothetical protein [Thermoanaerobacteraceae bacterium]
MKKEKNKKQSSTRADNQRVEIRQEDINKINGHRNVVDPEKGPENK